MRLTTSGTRTGNPWKAPVAPSLPVCGGDILQRVWTKRDKTPELPVPTQRRKRGPKHLSAVRQARVRESEMESSRSRMRADPGI